MAANIVIKGNAIFDGTGDLPFAGGIAISGKRIEAVVKGDGIDKYIGEGTRVIEAGDKLVMPGFNDGHTHISQGAFLEDPSFCTCVVEAGSKEELIEMLKKWGEENPEADWIFGYMCNNLAWEDQTLPDRNDMEKVSSTRPVVVQMADLHTMVINKAAMDKAGITDATESPADGIVEKDENGHLTGRFFDGGSFAISDKIYSPSDEVYYSVYENLMKKMASLGITSCSLVSPYGPHDDPTPYFAEMEKKGTLTTRVMLYPNIQEYEKEKFKAFSEKYHTDRIRVRGLKQLIDGVVSVYTASMLEPYTSDPSTCGCNSVDMVDFKKMALDAIKDGVALRIHTIGDKAIRDMLDIFEEAEKLYGKQGLRHVQEHLETVDPADQGRFKELGVAGCMQPWHMLFDLEGGDKGNGLYGDKDAMVGAVRGSYSWPMRDLLDKGMVLSLGSDFPVVGIEPMCEIYGGVTRQTFDGKPEGGWHPEQRITMAEALKAYTWGSAYIEGMEEEFGTLKEGLFADVIVLDRNLFNLGSDAEILETQVETTIMDGQVVFEK